jgi:hypothetical protein
METTFPEIERDKASRERDEKRPAVTKVFIRDLAELMDSEDGVYLHEIFDRIGDEIEVLMLKDSENVRELSFILSKCHESTGWARRIGEKKRHLYVMDRRRFSDD